MKATTPIPRLQFLIRSIFIILFGLTNWLNADTGTCYAVADSDNKLISISSDGSFFTDIGQLGVADVEAIAFNPNRTVLYGADAGKLGTINLNSGEFVPIGSFGDGHGAEGTVSFADVDSLEFDPTSGVLYGVARRGSSKDDALFKNLGINTPQHT